MWEPGEWLSAWRWVFPRWMDDESGVARRGVCKGGRETEIPRLVWKESR
jgi:hypothetical protein